MMYLPPSDSPVRLVYDDDDERLPLLYLVPGPGFWSLRGEDDMVRAKPCRELSLSRSLARSCLPCKQWRLAVAGSASEEMRRRRSQKQGRKEDTMNNEVKVVAFWELVELRLPGSINNTTTRRER